MGQVYLLPTARSKLPNFAYTYVRYYVEEGWYAAGKYFSEVVPEQLHKQVKNLIRKELLRRGIDVTF